MESGLISKGTPYGFQGRHRHPHTLLPHGHNRNGAPENLSMKPNGYDNSSGYLIWRCFYVKGHCSKCKNSCTDPKYGRVVKTRSEWDSRLYTNLPTAQMLIRRSIINALPRNVSTNASLMLTACTACSYTQRNIILS